MVYYYLLLFFYLSKLLFSGFFQFEGNFVRGWNNLEFCDCVSLTRVLWHSLHYTGALTQSIFITAISRGCYKDTGRRAIAPLEGRSRLLRGSYRRRRYAIQKCALAAKKRGFSTFAIQHQGWCASTKYAYRTYGRYGRSNRCRNGKGGPWTNDVYVLRG